MKRIRLLNGDNGIVASEVEARSCTYLKSAFIYKDELDTYHLVDSSTGISIVRSKKLKYLEENFNQIKDYYEKYKKTDAYQIKVERFTKLVAVYNYGKDH